MSRKCLKSDVKLVLSEVFTGMMNPLPGWQLSQNEVCQNLGNENKPLFNSGKWVWPRNVDFSVL